MNFVRFRTVWLQLECGLYRCRLCLLLSWREPYMATSATAGVLLRPLRRLGVLQGKAWTPSDPWRPSVPNRPWRPHLPDGPRGVSGGDHATATRTGPPMAIRPITASAGLALFHFVSRVALQRHRHILDGRMLVPIGYSTGGVSADFVAYPLLYPGTGRASTERVAPCVVRLDTRVGDPKSPYPLG